MSGEALINLLTWQAFTHPERVVPLARVRIKFSLHSKSIGAFECVSGPNGQYLWSLVSEVLSCVFRLVFRPASFGFRAKIPFRTNLSKVRRSAALGAGLSEISDGLEIEASKKVRSVSFPLFFLPSSSLWRAKLFPANSCPRIPDQQRVF